MPTLRPILFLLTAALGLACAAVPAGAQAAEPAAAAAGGRIPLLHGPIAIDGVPDEAAWQDALVQRIGYEIEPGDNGAAPVRTEVRLGYTADALYVAFHAYDPTPGAIRAHLRDRDSAFSDDWVGVFLDTFDDHRRGYELIVNPLGVQADLIRDESRRDDKEDPSWDGLWTSAGRLTADGYTVELRIPFSTLRFPGGGRDQRWGIALLRNWPRDKRHVLASVPVPRESNCFQCQWAKYQGFAEARQGRNLALTPTLALSAEQRRDAVATPWGQRRLRARPGLDLAWTPSPAITVNATLNPDFSQVETDQLQLGFNDSFALFYQEKRPFFLEGADYFGTPFNVLYTRQIADPDAGLRITGRAGRSTYGALVARDATTVLLVPGVLGSGFRTLAQPADVAVARYRYDLDQHASVGVIGTFRRGDGYRNAVAGADLRWQRAAHTLTLQWLRSQSQYPAGVVADYRDDLGDDPRPRGDAWRLDYRYGQRTWSVVAGHQAVAPGFRADLGFIGQVGYAKSLLGGSRTWFRDGHAFDRIEAYADFDITRRHDGRLLERELEAELSAQGPRQSNLALFGLARDRLWQDRLHAERILALNGNLRPNGRLQLAGGVQTGQVLDLAAARTGRRLQLKFGGNASFGRGGLLAWDLLHQRLRRDGGTAFTAQLANLSGSWQLDPRQRLRLILQGSRVQRDPALYPSGVNARSRDWAGQLVYSYKVDPRTALYAGGSYGAFMDDDNPDLFGNARSLFLKLSWGFQPAV